MKQNISKEFVKLSKEFQKRYMNKTSTYFEELNKDQFPGILWIGSSDSRVDPQQILGTEPGSIFVHRNFGSQVNSENDSVMASISYSVQNLNVSSVIICGVSDCNAIKSSCSHGSIAPENMNHVLSPIRSIFESVMLDQNKNVSDWDNLNEDEQANIKSIVCKINIQNQYNNLMDIDFIKEKVSQNKLEVLKLFYRIEDGVFESLN